VDVERWCAQTVLDIWLRHVRHGFDGASCGVRSTSSANNRPISPKRRRKDERKQGRRPGIDVRLCTNETDVLMPAPITLAHRLVKRQAQVRKNGKLSWLRPDAKSQVTLRYRTTGPWAWKRWCCPPSTPTTSAPSTCVKR